jgi:hypothetical protein
VSRTPPHDIDAERGLAGAALATRDWGGPIPIVPYDDWYHPAYLDLYLIGVNARRRGDHIDDDLPRDLQPMAWKALNGWTPSQLPTYARRITETATKRQFLADLEAAYHTAWDDPDEARRILARHHLPTPSVTQPPEA